MVKNITIDDLDDKYKLSSYLRRFSWMHPKSTWSFSKLGSYNGCNRRFKYIYIDKVKLDKEFEHSIPFIKGRFIHSRIERSIINKFNLNPADLYNPTVHNDGNKINITVKDILSWNNILEEFYRSDFYLKLVSDLGSADFINTEYSIKYKNLFIGYIDLVSITNGTLYIVDWKSGKSKDLSFNQLCTYAFVFVELFLELGYKITDVHIRYAFVEDPTYDRSVQLPLHKFLDEYLPSISRYKDIMDKLESEDTEKGKFIAEDEGWVRTSNTSECRYCTVKSYCEKDKEDISNMISDILN